MQKKPGKKLNVPLISGIGFTLLIAVLGFILQRCQVLNHIGPLHGHFIAVIYRQVFGYPEKLRNGIQFSSKKLLRFAIILLSIKA